MKILELKSGIIYGPVNSRRIGSSLGINLFPGKNKLCTFDCVYCQYGWNGDRQEETPLPDPSDIALALESALVDLKEKKQFPGYITFSGNGEPTLHPSFNLIVKEVISIRDNISLSSKIALLSNSTQLHRNEVQEALSVIEVRIMKFDCGNSSVFGYYNNPSQGISIEIIGNNLVELSNRLPIYIQTLFAGGSSGNYNEENIEGWIGYLSRIKPKGVQIYTLSRGYPEKSLEAMKKAQLSEISERLKRQNIHSEVY